MRPPCLCGVQFPADRERVDDGRVDIAQAQALHPQAGLAGGGAGRTAGATLVARRPAWHGSPCCRARSEGLIPFVIPSGLNFNAPKRSRAHRINAPPHQFIELNSTPAHVGLTSGAASPPYKAVFHFDEHGFIAQLELSRRRQTCAFTSLLDDTHNKNSFTLLS